MRQARDIGGAQIEAFLSSVWPTNPDAKRVIYLASIGHTLEEITVRPEVVPTIEDQ